MKTKERDQTTILVLTGVLTALVTVSIMVLPIPIPMTTGYVNLGDGMIFLAVMLVGRRHGAFAGGVGAALADILLSAAAWAPWTLAIKAGMAFIVGTCLHSGGEDKSASVVSVWGIGGMALATAFMAAGYYVAESVMYGNWAAPLVGVPWNLIQGAVGTAAACALAGALKKTPAKKYFAY